MVQPIYYTDQIQRCLDSFFRKSSPPKICEEVIHSMLERKKTGSDKRENEASWALFARVRNMAAHGSVSGVLQTQTCRPQTCRLTVLQTYSHVRNSRGEGGN